MKSKKKLKELEQMLQSSREQLTSAAAHARTAMKRAEEAKKAAAKAHDNLKQIEKLLKREQVKLAARKRVAKKQAIKKVRKGK